MTLDARSRVEILIVEDSPTQAQQLRLILESNGYGISVAAGGEEAMALLDRSTPDIVLSDIMMPGMDGYELCRKIKESPATAAVSVVLLTTLSDPKDVVRALECKADGFIVKPYGEEELLHRVRRVLAAREAPHAKDDRADIEVLLEGDRFLITADRRKILDLLVIALDMAISKNRDLTETRNQLRVLNDRLERRVEERTKVLTDTIQELDTFTYTVAHDLRAPLRGIHRYGELLLAEYVGRALDPEGQAFLGKIVQDAKRMDSLILDLLTYSRLARSEIEVARVPLEEFLERLIREHDGIFQECRARVKVEGALPAVRSDRVMLTQALANLLTNACKFVVPGQRPDITLRAEKRAGRVRLWVEDRGIGIDPKHHERIFRLFERLEGATYTGTGIGLALALKAMERIGGKIGVESRPGGGSRFWLDLAAAEEEGS